ncbi:MAG: hypothetical protein HS108_07735 [Planctomycetes bacterium]|jgi:hypothetical protein|nr:hypothetical protein [Planctomycetota bacterium]MCL4729371.1 hypothetical protein [Planctomycetota bacterium]
MRNRINLVIVALALAAGALAGIAAGSGAGRVEARSADVPPVKVAYVDFLSLFKGEKQLESDQRRIYAEAEELLQAIDVEMAPRVERLEADRRLYKPHEQKHWTAMQNLLAAQREYNTRRLKVESDAQKDLRAAAIDSFVRLRNLVTGIATQRGYSQVLNIVRNPEKAAEASDDFRVLQQQLLISPVIYYDKEHDLTDVVAAEAKKLWGVEIKIELDGATRVQSDGKEGEALARVAQGDDNKERIDFEVRLGESVRFRVKVTNNGQPATGRNADLSWWRTGIKSGEVKDDGSYRAPAECPEQSDIVTVRVRSLVDSTTLDIRVRLVDKEGKRIDMVKLAKEREAARNKKTE